MHNGRQLLPCVHSLFEIQAEKSPQASALLYKNTTLSYEALNQSANQLAHYLRREGGEIETSVGICMERSPEMVKSILGVLKAGGIYVPLDPTYPDERLTFMMHDANIQILLTHRKMLESRLASLLFSFPSLKVICLDDAWLEIARESKDNPLCQVTPENLAYIMYTSGSTGQPKGIAIPHRSIPGVILNVSYVHLDANQVFLQHSSISWDACTFELWAPLCHGALCVLYPELIPDIKVLGEIIKMYRVSVLFFTTSLFNTIIDATPEVFIDVEQLLVGGEALSVIHIRRALDLLPATQIINVYGPSECTVFSCCYPIPRPLQEDCRSIPIGKPIGDRTIYILDAHLGRVPIGQRGELCVAGPALARGYWSQPELTAKSFVCNPFGTKSREFLYKTGDLARYLPDGNIEFLGRIDNQVKLRGFRIEPGEIETVLGQHPMVQRCAVLVKKGQDNEKQLVAYIVLVPGGVTLVVEELCGHLREKLPTYMIPSTFLFLEAFPLLANGKLNHDVLLALDGEVAAAETPYALPESEMEQLLTTIWQEFLPIENVHIHKNFFDLGAHSLVLAQIHTRLQGVLQREFSILLLFQYPTISSLATVLDQLKDESPPLSQAECSGAIAPTMQQVQDRADLRRQLTTQQMLRAKRQAASDARQ